MAILGPLYELRARINGAPFRVGDSIQILIGEHRGTVTRIYEIWPERRQIRAELGDAARNNVRDVFGETSVMRIAPPQVQASHRMRVGSTPRSVWLACGGLALISLIAACLNWREAFFVARFRETLVSRVEHPGVYALHGAVWYAVAAANVLYLAWRSQRRRTGLLIVGSTLLGSLLIALLLAYAR